jgi:hypothetical protein
VDDNLLADAHNGSLCLEFSGDPHYIRVRCRRFVLGAMFRVACLSSTAQMTRPKKAAADTGAITSLFHAGQSGRALPDEPHCSARLHTL